MSTFKIKRNTEVELLRFFMVLVVVFFHRYEPIIQRGYLAVEFFFILTGYLTAATISKKINESFSHAWQIHFLKKKIQSFYPELIVACGIGCLYSLCSCCIGKRSFLEFLGHTCFANILQNLFFLRMTGLAGLGGSCAPAWYLSSMIIALIILVPIIRHSISPLIRLLISLCLYGFIIHNLDGLEKESYADWVVFTYTGNLRAVAGILLGSVAYDVSSHVSKINFNFIHRLGFSCLVVLSLCLFVIICFCRSGSLDGVSVCTHFVIITACFSQQTLFKSLLNHDRMYSVCCTLGKFSLPLYLGHIYAIPFYNQLSTKFNLGIVFYLLMALLFGLFVAIGAHFTRRIINHFQSLRIESINSKP